eukprot:TRINITY_DN1397_c0_g1_i8.p1 TRINITY_DN1397_c0_g1~~TRINITY_DN1397_c0_g1_i8.p1  ORF type:complete len:553 (+),score=236.26 TRINITY_DN1397_c0_g1_i8:109-1659(+)
MAEELSKSAKKRMAKQARDAAHAEENQQEQAAAAPAAAAAAPKAAPAAAKGKAKAAAGGYPADSKAKAAAKPAAAPASAKGATAPKAAAPKAAVDGWTEAPKSKSKKGGAKTEAPAAVPAEPEDPFAQYDDGTGGDWATCESASTKKKVKNDQKKAAAEAAKAEEDREAAEATKQAEIEKARAAKHALKAGKSGAAAAPAAPAPAPATTTTGSRDVKASIARIQVEAQKAAAAAAAKMQAEKDARLAAAPQEEEKAEEEAQKEEEPDNSITVTVTVPEEKLGVVIGPKGSKIKFLEEQTGVKRIGTSGTTVTIRGDPEKVPLAKKAIEDLVQKGYTELSYENFAEGSVMVPENRIPDIIGRGGEVVRTIKEKLNVEINIPKSPAGAKKSKNQKIKVDIVGSADSVNTCKDVISNILMFYHHEITHPCAVHAELKDLPDWANGIIIGRGGSEMKHIQNNFHVKVYIPREGESVNMNVVIVGSADDVSRAKTYIEKKIKAAEEEWNEGPQKKAGGDDW